MRFFQSQKKHAAVSAGFIVTLVAVVWCASCGSKSSGFTGDDGTGPGGSSGGDGGDMCFNCNASSGGGAGTSSGFGSSGGGDSGLPTVMGMNGPVSQNSCPGSLSAANVTALKGAKSNSASLKWLYPYDATIFPGGLQPPVLQWSQSGTPDGVYLHLHSQKYDFTGCFKGSNPPQLQIPVLAWATAFAQSGGKPDPLTVELSTISGSTVSGPIKETWTFAKGNLAGVVYYNTYGSKLVPGQNGQNGAVMKIAAGATQPTAFLYTTGTSVFPFGPCVSCHSLSANGSFLVAQQHFYPSSDPLNGKGSMAFDLTKTKTPDPTMPMASTLNDDWGFSAVYPDGTVLLTSGEAQDSTMTPLFPGVSGNNPGMIGPKPAEMYDTTTGATISYSGLSTPFAMMPMFSPDGKHIVYTEAPNTDAGVGAHTLTVMDFDLPSKTFSNARQVYHDGTSFPGWPFFTPDSKSIVFALGNTNNFASEEPPTPAPAFNSQLYIVSAAGGGTARRLDELGGLNGAGTDYLPSPNDDYNLDFYPTVNPISAGGYFWVYFTSRRSYGNLYAKGSGDVGSKSIWVAAVDINPAPGADPSHPAFYLPGQELGSGNIRAFSVLAPCVGEGATCESGLDCCGGTCTSGKCGVPAACAMENNKCTDGLPCCDSSDMCIGGYCGVAPPK